MREIIGLFFLIAGFIIGLGAVTVIDVLGFLSRKSGYWTESTIRAHKVTKPLIWLGITLAIIGGLIFYPNQPISIIPVFHIFIAIALILNGLFLSFWLSPRLIERERRGEATKLLPRDWQIKIAISLIVSDLGWWGGLLLLTVYLLR